MRSRLKSLGKYTKKAQMDNPLSLRENWTLGYKGESGDKHINVTKDEWKEVRDFVLDDQNQNDRRVMRVWADTIRAENYVGALQTSNGTTIEILPKIDLDHGEDASREREIFLRMLRHWRNAPCPQFDNAAVRELKDFPLLEAFITMFLKDMLELTRRGLACAYNEIEENRHYLKGKLQMAGHLRHNLVHKERFYVRYEEFSANRPINRLLKSALLRLQRLSRDETNLAHIRQAMFYFDEIPASANIDADLMRARVDRMMPLYDRLFPWARLFLKDMAPVTWRGRNLAMALLFPMELIFEDYVSNLVRKAATGWKVATQERKYCLMEKNPQSEKEFFLKPDIVARNKDRTWVMDAKWKTLNAKSTHYDIIQTDLYQLYAYGKKYEIGTGASVELYLLYPYNENFKTPLEFEYEEGLRLTAFPVNVALEEDFAPATSETKTLRDLFASSTPHSN